MWHDLIYQDNLRSIKNLLLSQSSTRISLLCGWSQPVSWRMGNATRWDRPYVTHSYRWKPRNQATGFHRRVDRSRAKTQRKRLRWGQTKSHDACCATCSWIPCDHCSQEDSAPCLPSLHCRPYGVCSSRLHPTHTVKDKSSSLFCKLFLNLLHVGCKIDFCFLKFTTEKKEQW